ncbi:MAG TPA: hypothetical protein VKX39_12210 [Bryobacteraceae bacterium]|jgi:tetratricopeptide (TPR) repeat protein|nr:hypothetical protein [Bryobacteraceae bacterium]
MALATMILVAVPAFAQDKPVPERAAQEKAGDKQQEKKREWKDRAEYDLYESIVKTQDPNQWLAVLNNWKERYPESDYADVRRQLYLEAYRALNKPGEAFAAAQDVLKDNPNNLVALSAIVGYIYNLVPISSAPLSPQQSQDLAVAEQAAHTILDNTDVIYSRDNRPANMTDQEASGKKPALRVFAQKTLGYIALVRKDYPKAQTELTKALAMDPNQGQVSFWLGEAVLAQNKEHPETQPEALYDFARAASYSGAGSLPANDRKQVQDYLIKVYTQYHGSAQGLDRLMTQASAQALPPAGFTIKSKADVEREKIEAEEAAARANPMLALWKRIHQELASENGAAYFENSMKGALLPGGAEGVTKFRGRLISATPAERPRTLVLAIENPDKPDATLKLDSPLSGKMEPGGEISFDGVADSYTKDPFMVTFSVEKGQIEGWTGKSTPAKRTTVSRKSGAGE